MDSPSPRRVAARSSLVDSFRGCGLPGIRIGREDLKMRIVIPEYLRLAMRDSIRFKNPNAGEQHAGIAKGQAAPEAPIVVFVNSKSGGRHGTVLKGRLQDLMCEEQVFDLSIVKPNEFVQYGLACLENLATLGDNCAKDTREKMRVMVAGGDGTVGWVLGSLSQLYKQNRLPVPPTGIIPLGTGNDLSRSFGWGGSFPFAWKSAVKRSLYKAVTGPDCRLDTWQIVVSMPSGENIELPYSLKYKEEGSLDQLSVTELSLWQDLVVEGELPEKSTCFEGVFYNYFSIGMDAQVAYGFHHLRNEKPYLAHGPIANKVIYSGYSCTQGWFCTPCTSDPSLRGLNNILRMYIKKVNHSEWEQIPVPSSVRAIVAVNLHNYGSGRNPWGNLKPEYLEKRGFVEAHADDGLLEIFGLKQGWHASFVMVELISAKHIAQAAAVRLEIRGGEWRNAYLQMDGEPWKQPMDKEYSTFVEIKRVPFQSLMINGE
ncbi:diacylglycerol kinase 7-like isoform X1 [Macadamia integrifolia]|uniref:diacylglycerol kinase 7-like isoform X1 n=1 Tax=Macadamia integrifolia TaxID=60698 RepID=UPI001C4FAA3B|nr:diacylglycerol kinase 7-like isoform X1 [Macadamia integrifolia]